MPNFLPLLDVLNVVLDPFGSLGSHVNDSGYGLDDEADNPAKRSFEEAFGSVLVHAFDGFSDQAWYSLLDAREKTLDSLVYSRDNGLGSLHLTLLPVIYVLVIKGKLAYPGGDRLRDF